MRHFFIAAGFVSLTWTAGAFAQSLNVDLGPSGGSSPSASYGAGAGQPGFWNYIVGLGGTATRDLNGALTSVVTVTNTPGASANPIDGASADENALMTTFIGGKPILGSALVLFNLVPGQYDLFVYTWDGFSGESDHIDVLGEYGGSQGFSTFQFTAHFTSVWPGGQVEGVTYGKATLVIAAGDRLNITTLPQGGGEDPYVGIIQGFQLVMVPAPGSAALLAGGVFMAVRRRR